MSRALIDAPEVVDAERIVRRVVVNDPWQPASQAGRTIEERPYTGGALRSYLPPECHGYGEQEFVCGVNGLVIPEAAWDTLVPRPGDSVQVIPRVADPVTAVLIGVNIVLAAAGIWSAADQARRAKIQAHHAARRAASQAAHMADSSTYGWTGIHNTTEPGRPIPLLFGEHRVGGQIVYAEPRHGIKSSPLVDMVIVISQGEVAGPKGGNLTHDDARLLIDGTPLSDWSGVVVDSRNGTKTQSAMAKVLPSFVPRNTTPNIGYILYQNKASTGSTLYITQPNRAWIRFIIRAPYGFRYDNPAGGPNKSVSSGTATVRMRWRSYPSGGFGAWLTVPFTRAAYPTNQSYGAAISIAPMQFESPALALDRYEFEIEVTAFTVAHGTVSNFNWITLIEAQEFSEAPQRYIGQAVCALANLPASRLRGSPPTVTAIWQGLKLRVYSDTTTYTEEFTRLPAWHILNILANTDWGGGGLLDWDQDFDLQSFIDAATFHNALIGRGVTDPIVDEDGNGDTVAGSNKFKVSGATINGRFTDGTVKIDDTLVLEGGADAGSYRIATIQSDGVLLVTETDGSATSFTGATGANWHIDGTEPRFLCDYYIDGQTELWEAVNAIANTCRSAIVWVNGKVALIPDQSSSVVQVIGKDMIVPGSLQIEYMSRRAAANITEVQFLNADKDYEQDVARYEDPQALTDGDPHIPTRIEQFAITRPTHAIRQAKFHALSNNYEPFSIILKVHAQALALVWGDRFRLGEDLRAYRSLEYDLHQSAIVVSATATTVTLDRDVYIDTSNAVYVSIQHIADDTIDDTVQVDSPSGAWTRVLTVGAWATTPAAGDSAVLHTVFGDSSTPQDFKVISITEDGDAVRELRAVPFNVNLYTDADDPDTAPTFDVT